MDVHPIGLSWPVGSEFGSVFLHQDARPSKSRERTKLALGLSSGSGMYDKIFVSCSFNLVARDV